MSDDQTMWQPTGARQPGVIGDVVAGMATAMLVLAPMPLAAQEGAGANGGEPSGEQSDGTSADGSEEAASDQKKSGDQKGDAPTPKLYLMSAQSVHEDISSIVPERIGALLRDRVEGDGGVDVLPHLETMKRAEADRPVTAAISKAREKYTSGLGLVNAGRYEEAAENLQSAVETLKKNVAQLQEFGVLTDALKNLARAYWETGSNYDARRQIRQYAHLVPDAELDPEKYPKGLRDIYDRETGKVDKAGTGTLEIDANVEGATVLIDGKEKGKTPASVEDVGFGHHYLVVRHPKEGTFSKKIRVRGRGKTQSFEAELGGEGSGQGAMAEKSKEPSLPSYYTALQSSIRDGNFGDDLDPYLSELRQETEADFVAWVAMLKNDNAYVAAPFVYRMEDGTLIQGENVEFNFELSNLMAGVDSLQKAILGAVDEMPKAKRVEKVSLVEEKEEKPKRAEAGETKEDEQKDEGGEEVARADQTEDKSSTSGSEAESVEPPPTPEDPPPEDDEGGNKALLYGLVAGGTLLVGAGVAGGVYYFGGGAGQQPNGFEATITW